MKKAFLLSALMGGLTLAACGGSDMTQSPSVNDGTSSSMLESDFSLQDVNETSPTFGQNVSPRDYLEKVTGWYFGRAT